MALVVSTEKQLQKHKQEMTANNRNKVCVGNLLMHTGTEMEKAN